VELSSCSGLLLLNTRALLGGGLKNVSTVLFFVDSDIVKLLRVNRKKLLHYDSLTFSPQAHSGKAVRSSVFSFSVLSLVLKISKNLIYDSTNINIQQDIMQPWK
jgi:hypothetical protein